MGAIGARAPLMGMGTSMIGPTLLEYGTEEQKHEHIPKIVRGEDPVVSGLLGTQRGSDLAALKTRAEDKGDHLPHQRPEDLDLRRRHRGLDVHPGAHGPDAPKHEASASCC